MQALYRRDYDGEFVVLSCSIVNGKSTFQREWIPNAIENHHISGRAAVIGSRADQELFDFRRLVRHKGGLLAKKRLQTYGTGNLWKEMQFDFFVTTDANVINEIDINGYYNRCTVYSGSSQCLAHPGKLYLIPYAPSMDNLAVALYLAAFDGHQEIFLLGYNNDTVGNTSNWMHNITTVMKTYHSTQFIVVGVQSNHPAEWRSLDNVRSMDYRKWISYCDV